MFKWSNPTAQLLGRWQPWHDGHTALFEKALEEFGQVCIMIRDVPREGSANDRLPGQDDNPYIGEQVTGNIITALAKKGYTEGVQYVIIRVPNIVDISYGRGVGYTFTEHDLGEKVHSISATKIRAELREKGEL